MFEKIYNVFSLTERDKMVKGLVLGHFVFKNVCFLRQNEYVLVGWTGYFSLCYFILKQKPK